MEHGNDYSLEVTMKSGWFLLPLILVVACGKPDAERRRKTTPPGGQEANPTRNCSITLELVPSGTSQDIQRFYGAYVGFAGLPKQNYKLTVGRIEEVLPEDRATIVEQVKALASTVTAAGTIDFTPTKAILHSDTDVVDYDRTPIALIDEQADKIRNVNQQIAELVDDLAADSAIKSDGLALATSYRPNRFKPAMEIVSRYTLSERGLYGPEGAERRHQLLLRLNERVGQVLETLSLSVQVAGCTNQ